MIGWSLPTLSALLKFHRFKCKYYPKNPRRNFQNNFGQISGPCPVKVIHKINHHTYKTITKLLVLCIIREWYFKLLNTDTDSPSSQHCWLFLVNYAYLCPYVRSRPLAMVGGQAGPTTCYLTPLTSLTQTGRKGCTVLGPAQPGPNCLCITHVLQVSPLAWNPWL